VRLQVTELLNPEMTPLDPNQPLPKWEHKLGEERDPERIDILIEQLRAVWKKYPGLRLTQLLVALLDSKPNRLFYLEDHLVSAKLLQLREEGWPGQRQDSGE
jgi:uncharacterized protein YihD (DUF1040 family)